MNEIEEKLFALIKQKGLIHVATLLGHQSTSIIDRWQREGKIPDGKKYQVMKTLEEQADA